MLLLLPMDTDEIQEASLVSIADAKKWALLTVEEGQVVEYSHFDTHEEIEEWIDIVVVSNDKEYVWPFMEKQVMVLVAYMQRSVDDIVEAYLFKELMDFPDA